ncbi:hypothetical protein AMECASPLE_031399 [Ameca splendens]|uniref:Uncharacterized protein n=1 Tax=Ameca splendens TaxID=208324 RepID=A0ABV0Y681_9TELE
MVVIKEIKKICQQNEALETENIEIKEKLIESNAALINMDNQLQQKAQELQNALDLVSSLEQHSTIQCVLSISLKSNKATLEIKVQQLNINMSENEEAMRIQQITESREPKDFRLFFKDLKVQTDEFRAQTVTAATK